MLKIIEETAIYVCNHMALPLLRRCKMENDNLSKYIHCYTLLIEYKDFCGSRKKMEEQYKLEN